MKHSVACGWSLVLAAFLLASVATPGLCEETKIAVADFTLVLKEFHKTKGAEEELERLQTDFKGDLERMQKKLGELEKEFEDAREKTRNPMLNEEAVGKMRAEAETKLVALKEYEQEILKYKETGLKDLREQSMRITKRISDEILEAVGQYAKEKKLDLVLDSGQLGLSGRGIVLHKSDALDITNDIIAAINKGR